MKKLMFLTMVFGFFMVLSGSASAQQGVVIGATGSQKLKPKVGEKVTFAVHTPASARPEVGIKSGQKVCLVSIFNGGQQSDVLMNMDCTAKKGVRNIYKIVTVENPKNLDIILSDKVTLDVAKLTISFTRQNKETVKITFKQ